MSKAASKRQAVFEVTTGSVEETQTVGERLGGALRAGDVVALFGELGSGKTTLIQGIARGLGRDPATIKSPTFVLIREYPGDLPLVHVDGYRLDDTGAAAWLDVEQLFGSHKITLIEWAERFEGVLPEQAVQLRLSHVSTNRRRITIVASSPRATDLIKKCQTLPKADISHTVSDCSVEKPLRGSG